MSAFGIQQTSVDCVANDDVMELATNTFATAMYRLVERSTLIFLSKNEKYFISPHQILDVKRSQYPEKQFVREFEDIAVGWEALIHWRLNDHLINTLTVPHGQS